MRREKRSARTQIMLRITKNGPEMGSASSDLTQ